MLAILEQIGFKMPLKKGEEEEPLTCDDLRFTLKNRILDPEATCHDQQVFNNTQVYCLIHIPNTKEDFEALEVVSGVTFEYDYPQKKKEEPKKVADE